MVQHAINMIKMIVKTCVRYVQFLTQKPESPPYLVQLSVDFHMWSEDGIQFERSWRDTIVGRNSKIDNLVQVYHFFFFCVADSVHYGLRTNS